MGASAIESMQPLARWIRCGPFGDATAANNEANYEARISAVPALGKHSERIFGELGQSSGDIAALREAGVV